jgi:hypothetical protein
MEISIRYIKVSLSKCESDRVCRSLPTGDSLDGRALQTASNGCQLSSAAITSRSSETGRVLQATFSKRFFFSPIIAGRLLFDGNLLAFLASDAIMDASSFVRLQELISRAGIEIERSCLRSMVALCRHLGNCDLFHHPSLPSPSTNNSFGESEIFPECESIRDQPSRAADR